MTVAAGETTGFNFWKIFATSNHRYTGTSTRIAMSIYSNFFQVDGTLSEREMLEMVCNHTFRREVEAYVNRDFSKAVAEFSAHEKCDPRLGENTADGDGSCMDWFENTMGQAASAYSKMAVPRCVTVNGFNECQLQARKAGVLCSMKWDTVEKRMVPYEEVTPGHKILAATDDSIATFPCDKSVGLKCVMQSNPTFLFSSIIWPGEARCAETH